MNWTRRLSPARPDIEHATQSLGRLPGIANVALSRGDIDLSFANLQGVNLANLNLSSALLGGARLDGAKLLETRLSGALLLKAGLQGAFLWNPVLDDETDLVGANLRGAAFRSSDEATIAALWPHRHDLFADGTVRPDDPERPAHRPTEILTFDAFLDRWRAWAETLP